MCTLLEKCFSSKTLVVSSLETCGESQNLREAMMCRIWWGLWCVYLGLNSSRHCLVHIVGRLKTQSSVCASVCGGCVSLYVLSQASLRFSRALAVQVWRHPFCMRKSVFEEITPEVLPKCNRFPNTLLTLVTISMLLAFLCLPRVRGK